MHDGVPMGGKKLKQFAYENKDICMGPLQTKIFSIKIDQFVYIFPIFASPHRHYLDIAEPGLGKTSSE